MTTGGLRARLVDLPRRAKQAILVAGDMLILAAAFAAALGIFLHQVPVSFQDTWAPLALAIMIAIPLFARAGFYAAIIRFTDTRLPLATLVCMSLVVLVVEAAGTITGHPAFRVPRQVLLVFGAFAMLGILGSRLLMRAWLVGHGDGMGREPVIIYGAGNAGARLLAALAQGNSLRVVAIVDDNPLMHGRTMGGVRVWAPGELTRLAGESGSRRVLLALPSASRFRRQQVINRLADLPVHVQTIPDITDLVNGAARVDDLQDVEAVDLLGRDPVPPNEALLARCIRGKCVMVTGAGGSIGSELCRQIIALGPRRLVLFELSELALYNIEHELRSRLAASPGFEVEVVALLGSVHHRERVRGVMQAFAIQTVYHAAAYKHVPIVELNMVEGIHNNIIGTWYAAEAALEAGVETFVLVSTDKAVSPVNVMGATKRFAELVLQGMAQRVSQTRFCMVRFGNVLESSGSVVPLFRKQIRRGGPVTVTDPEVIRYFMTIPEAAQLVIQAGSMGRGGDVFVLDMGEPVRIDDLARRMIRLMGLTVRDGEHPEGDIAIEYSGLRQGEKLFEELLIGTNVTRTEHPMILRAVEECLSWEQTEAYLGRFLQAANAFDCERTSALLLEAVAGYRPSGEAIQDLVWHARRGKVPDNVVSLPVRPSASAG